MAAECTRCEDPFPSVPPEQRTPDQWDEFDHLNSLRADAARLAAARQSQPATAQTPVRSTT